MLTDSPVRQHLLLDVYTLNRTYKPPLYKLQFLGNYFIGLHKNGLIDIKHQHLPIFIGKTCIHCHGNSGGTEGLILKFWRENLVHIIKVDTTRFYRIVISTTKA